MCLWGVSRKGSAKEGRSTLNVVAPSHGMGSQTEDKGQMSWAAAFISLFSLAGTQCGLPSLSPSVTGLVAFIATPSLQGWTSYSHYGPEISISFLTWLWYYILFVYSQHWEKHLILALNSHPKTCSQWPNLTPSCKAPSPKDPTVFQEPHELQHMELWRIVNICPMTMR